MPPPATIVPSASRRTRLGAWYGNFAFMFVSPRPIPFTGARTNALCAATCAILLSPAMVVMRRSL
jgi:hypothetical protein